MATSIVTGAAGFIGSHLTEALLNRGDRVIGIDQFNDYYDPGLKRQNVEALRHHPNFELIEANLLHLDLPLLLAQADYVYHQAAQPGVRASWGQGFRDYSDRNLDATQALLEAAKQSPQIKQFLFASTSSVYGDAETLPTHEGLCPKPVSPYGITKLAAEQLCLLYHKNFGVPITGFRYFSVYGPRQRPDMAFHKFFKAILADQPISIYGDGRQTRDFTFVSDVVAANLAATDCAAALGQVMNIGGGSRVGLLAVLDTLELVVGHPFLRAYQAPATGDARHTAADITLAQRLIGYRPCVTLQQGLERQWDWIQPLYRQPEISEALQVGLSIAALP
jgi:nucleoside-diphosphate-sugar epimerase